VKVAIRGGGWYGAHLCVALLRDGHDAHVYESGPRLFAGASGNNPARLHIGPHYARSHATREACRAHYADFMAEYGHLTRAIRTNIYAIASEGSMVDFGTYLKILTGEIDYVRVEKPSDFGLQGIEGAILVGERHIVIDDVRAHFEAALAGHFTVDARGVEPDADFTIDATFCSNSSAGVDRYEPCLVLLLEGSTDTAVTVVDGPFPSLYPWNESRNLCSLSSAKWTPFSKALNRYDLARRMLDTLKRSDIEAQGEGMIASMAEFYPAVRDFRVADYMTSIRAMPKSAADARLASVTRTGPRSLRVMAGKIDAVTKAAELVRAELEKT
jgi:hypothetical protein